MEKGIRGGKTQADSGEGRALVSWASKGLGRIREMFIPLVSLNFPLCVSPYSYSLS